MTLSPADRAELTELAARYALAVDERRPDDVPALFTEDGVLVTPDPPRSLAPVTEHRGSAGVRAALGTVAGVPRTFHALAGSVLDPAGPDEARGTVACTAHHVTGGADGVAADLVWHLRYTDRYRREAGSWRFARRELAIVFVEHRPVRVRTAGIERRLAVLEATAAIQRLKYRYWRACDRKDVSAFRACFVASGADIDFERMGRFDDAGGITDVFARVALRRDDAGRHLILDMHHGLHPDITVLDETSAVGRWTLRFRQLNLRDRTEKVAAVEYDDAYVVEDGEWRISRCHARTLWAVTRPLPAEAHIDENFDEHFA